MGRIARVVVRHEPHHVTQRGVRSMRVFFSDNDRRTYLQLLRAQGEAHGVSFLAYCLMSNHVHLVAVPKKEDSLARAIGEAHRRYTRMVNFRQGVRGYLFQGRFFSCPLDEAYLLSAVRYVERNPMRAKLVRRPWEYLWSSARYHVGLRKQDTLVEDRDLFGLVDDWRAYLAIDEEAERVDRLRQTTRTGKPCGDVAFVKRIQRRIGRVLLPRKPGPRPQAKRKS